MKNSGVTLTELAVVVAIIGIVIIAVGFSFQGWAARYNVERQIKEMHTDLMEAKAKAMSKSRVHFITLATGQYVVYEDTDPAPDGNGVLTTASDTSRLTKSLDARYPITWIGATATLEFNTRGIAAVEKTICSNTTADSDYNCIVISDSRINLGQLTTFIPSGGVCDTANCIQK